MPVTTTRLMQRSLRLIARSPQKRGYKEFEPEKIGSTVEWFDKVEPLEFKISEYKNMLNEFKKHFEIDKQKWQEKNRIFQEEQKIKNNERPTTAMSKRADGARRNNNPFYKLWSWLTGK